MPPRSASKVLVTAAGYLLAHLVSVDSASAQLFGPPASDGEVRVLYHELRDLTEVWLMLKPKGPSGDKLPIFLTLNVAFPGKRPAAPLQQLEIQAHVGMLWAPRPELTLILNGSETLDLAGPNPRILFAGDTTSMFAVIGTVSIDTLKRIASARSLTGNALRLAFELDESQRRAISAFSDRVQSEDPALTRAR